MKNALMLLAISLTLYIEGCYQSDTYYLMIRNTTSYRLWYKIGDGNRSYLEPSAVRHLEFDTSDHSNQLRIQYGYEDKVIDS